MVDSPAQNRRILAPIKATSKTNTQQTALKRRTMGKYAAMAAIALMSSTVSAHVSDGRLCSKVMSGSAVLSDREYSSGEFEFKLRPSLSQGIVTTVGLANDGTQH